MLGRLIQGYGKANPNLESTTEEQHCRALLWPSERSEYVRGLPLSPPATPVGSPAFRIGPYDDRGGLELNDSKDLRIIIAQDAFGSLDRPIVLYDSNNKDLQKEQASSDRAEAGPISPTRKPSLTPTVASFNAATSPRVRNRSSTISGASSSWSRSAKSSDSNDKVTQLLECMFGVTSATKTGSSTKMHVLLSNHERNDSQGHQAKPSAGNSATMGRVPLLRARTSYQITTTQRSNSKDDGTSSQDVVLVTRMFSVNLSDTEESLQRQMSLSDTSPVEEKSPTPFDISPSSKNSASAKKQKLVEKKTPMFAIGLLFNLPNIPEVRPGTGVQRPSSRMSHNSASMPNSYGSDIASSWTLLENLSGSLASSKSQVALPDQRVELITSFWDVILRSLAVVEHEARVEILQLLHQVNYEMANSAIKAPKGPKEQRTNQRNVYIRQSGSLADFSSIEAACKHTLKRICYALRIPRVMTGLGFVDGHWLDETRYLVQICGSKTQNFFLFNLMTAFLGNHTEWLGRLGPDWYRKQFQAMSKKREDIQALVSRTVIVSEHRSIARRLIFLLASFLPSILGRDALQGVLNEFRSPLTTPGLSNSSPADDAGRKELAQRRINRSHRHQVSFGQIDAIPLSTSASSTGSVRTSNSTRKVRPHQYLVRKDSDTVSVTTPSEMPNGHGSIRKTSISNPTLTSNPVTPITHFSGQRDSYFPDGITASGSESAASADLAKILRRDSTSLSQMSTASNPLTSLLNNVGGIWSRRREGSAGNRSPTPAARESGGSSRRVSLSLPARSIMPEGKATSETIATVADHPGTGASNPITVEQNDKPQVQDVPPPRLTVDNKDGVVDVDVNLPGFLSFSGGDDATNSAIFAAHSPSNASLDGVGSMHSSRSQLTSNFYGPDEVGNVAGFLSRYHEDFILQAVKPYDKLLEDIKSSMIKESISMDISSHETGDTEESGWINVCSTLIADVRTFSIQRLTLRRRINEEPYNDVLDDDDVPGIGQSAAPSIPSTSNNPQIRDENTSFVMESVMDFDTILTDAIERLLEDVNSSYQFPNISRSTHSRTYSTGTMSTSRSTPPTAAMRSNFQRHNHAFRADCRHVVVSALEKVVQSVNEDLHKHDKGRDIQGPPVSGEPAVRGGIKQENVLREGVKKWMLDVETRSVW